MDDEKIKEFLKNPEIAATVHEFWSGVHKHVFEPEYRSQWIKLNVRRDGDIIEMQWQSTKGANHSYRVMTTIKAIAFSAQVGFIEMDQFDTKYGDGRHAVQLEQGQAYDVRFIFAETDQVDDFPSIAFQICVPLSPERREVLVEAMRLEENPEEDIRNEMNKFLRKQKAFDEMLKVATEQIKKKKLSEDEEADQIEDAKEHIAWLKEKFGL